MDNPFSRRATELLRDDEAFLAVVSPGPITHYLKVPGQEGVLYDRLVQIRGTPGSGKTTLARLFEFGSLVALLKNTSHTGHGELVTALRECGAITHTLPRVLGVRIPLESDYRDFWEFDYSAELKINLMTALLQARAVLGWFRHLRNHGIPPQDVEIRYLKEAEEVTDTVGGTNGNDVYVRAAQVESAIYKVATALVAPASTALPKDAIGPYRPFSIVEHFRVPGRHFGAETAVDLIPLVIFDDAHMLHPDQLGALERVLVRRELRIARWIIARFDILQPGDALLSLTNDNINAAYPGIKADRDDKQIILQSGAGRSTERNRFRKVARDMAGRYLRRMPLLNERGLTILGDCLADQAEPAPKEVLEGLRQSVERAKADFDISDKQVGVFRQSIVESAPPAEDLRLSMLLVMMNRYAVRRGQPTGQMFSADSDGEDLAVAANVAVREAAYFHIFHRYDRPYYFGIDDVCDASSENAEQFLQLCAGLVDAVVTRILRGEAPTLSPSTQHRLLREKGSSAVDSWNFPEVVAVRKLVQVIAERCLKTSLKPNGAVIANAFGVPQAEFDEIATTNAKFARVLQFAVAYNALCLVPNHSCKDKTWCLLELGGLPLLKYGLTLKRGGFVEGRIKELAKASGVPNQ